MLFEFEGVIQSKELSKLHFYLGGKLISNESTYLPTYNSKFQNFYQAITEEQFKNSNFEDLSPEISYKKIIEERDTNEDQFFRHLFKLDETIDQYTILVLQKRNTTEITWTCWDKNNCNSEHILNKIYSVQFPTLELMTTVNHLLEYLNKTTR